MLYRVCHYDPEADPDEPGGALHVAREHQGVGRHDNPHDYAALYGSRHAQGAVAEFLHAFRGQTMRDANFQHPDDTCWGLAAIDDANVSDLVNLDDAQELLLRGVRPSQVASRDRETTQEIAQTAFNEGTEGLKWWSILDTSWTNVTLFLHRVRDVLFLKEDPQPLSTSLPAVVAAADHLGVRLR